MSKCTCGKCKRCTDNWYSRRHQTREAQDAAREKYQSERGPKARKRRANERSTLMERYEAAERLRKRQDDPKTQERSLGAWRE